MKILRGDGEARRRANERYRARMKGDAAYLARQRELAAHRAAAKARNEIGAAFALLVRLPPQFDISERVPNT